MALHTLKTVQPYFDAVWAGSKPFEVRKNDRGFQVGDTIRAQLFDPETNELGQRARDGVITYILDGDQFGIEPGTVVLGMRWERHWGTPGTPSDDLVLKACRASMIAQTERLEAHIAELIQATDDEALAHGIVIPSAHPLRFAFEGLCRERFGSDCRIDSDDSIRVQLGRGRTVLVCGYEEINVSLDRVVAVLAMAAT